MKNLTNLSYDAAVMLNILEERLRFKEDQKLLDVEIKEECESRFTLEKTEEILDELLGLGFVEHIGRMYMKNGESYCDFFAVTSKASKFKHYVYA